MSSRCPSARSALPTRPGVDVSWCSTIRTGSNGGTGDREGDTGDRKGDTGEADNLPGKRRTGSVLASIGSNGIVFRVGGTGAGIIPKQRLISDELGPSSKQVAGQNS